MEFKIKKVKIFVTVPKENLEDIRLVIENNNVGVIGNYTNCTTSTSVIGTFKPNEKANPYNGKKNKLEYVTEEKLEFVCPIDKVKTVINEIRKVHPYEEPAIDIIPLLDEDCFI